MARPVKRKARKDYPKDGVSKGDKYYYVKIKTGPRSSRVMRQIKPFKRSQLTTSEYLSALYDWEDQKSELSNLDDAENLVNDIRELGEEQDAKRENMPEGLQQGDIGQLLEERANACEEAASEIEEIIGELDDDSDVEESELIERIIEIEVNI